MGRVFVLIFGLTSGLVAAAPAAATPPAGCVDLYAEAGYHGATLRLCGAGAHWLPYDPNNNVNWHYQVSSFSCGRGLELVRFRDGNVPGAERMLRCSEGAFGLPDSGFDDRATDIEIVDVPTGCVRLFEHPHGGGASYEVCGAGNWALPYQPGVVDWHYRVSSFVCGEAVDWIWLINGNVPGQQVNLSCGQGWSLPTFDNLTTNGTTYLVPDDCVMVYENPDFTGARHLICGEGRHWLPYDPGAGVDWHYRVSSFRCGSRVESARFLNGNVPGQQAEITCADDFVLPVIFNDLSTDVEVRFGFECTPWDGSVPAVGSWLRLKNYLARDQARHDWRPNLGNRYLVNVDHSGKGLLPNFTSQNPRQRAALYEVVESRSSARGPEVRLKSPPVGTAPGYVVGNAISNSGNYPLRLYASLGTGDQWLRLAHTFEVHCTTPCPPDTLTPPDATLQIDRGGLLRACTQAVDIYNSANIYFDDVKCNEYRVPRYGDAQRLLGKVRVEVCELW